MQTGLQLFDSSVIASSAKGQKMMPGTAKPTKEASDQLAGFLEIMSTLMALPPEQWKQSLAGIDATNADGESADLPCMVGNAGKNMPPAELLKLIMSMKGAVMQQLQSAKADGRPHPLLDMAEALMEDPQTAALDSQETGKAQVAPGTDPGAEFSQAVNSAQKGPAIDPGGNAGIRMSPGVDPEMDPETGKGGNPLAFEAAADAENKPPAIGQEETSKTFRHQNQASDFLFKASDAQTQGAPNPEPDKGRSTLAAGNVKTPFEDNLPNEKGGVADKAHQALAADSAKNTGVNAQFHVNRENFEERPVQRSDPLSGGHQGLLWRQEAGQVSDDLALSGEKEVLYQEKASSSDVIRQIVQRMSLQTNGAQSKMVIRLKPEFLGNVHLHVLTENHQVTVRMMADSILVKDIVEQNLPHLRAELQHHGLEIQKFDVFVANDDQGWRGGQEQAGFRDTLNQKQPRSGGGKSRHQRGKITFDTPNGKKIVQKDPGEIDYFA